MKNRNGNLYVKIHITSALLNTVFHNSHYVYQNKNEADAERTIHINTPFDMKLLNRIQTVLQKGKYTYTMSVDGNISYRHRLLAELSQEALNNSKEIAEKLAESQIETPRQCIGVRL